MKLCYARRKLPPSLNQRHGWNSRTRRFYCTQDVLNLRDDVMLCFHRSEISKNVLEPYEGDVSLSYTICPPRSKTDVDNFAKVYLDALVHCKIIGDDAQVQSIRGYRCQNCRNLKKGEKCRWAFHCELFFNSSSNFFNF